MRDKYKKQVALTKQVYDYKSNINPHPSISFKTNRATWAVMWETTSSTLKDGNWYADDDTISYPQLTIKVISSRPRRDDFFFIINKIPTSVNPILTTGSARRSRHSCTPSLRRPSLHPATLVSAPRCVRLCS